MVSHVPAIYLFYLCGNIDRLLDLHFELLAMRRGVDLVDLSLLS